MELQYKADRKSDLFTPNLPAYFLHSALHVLGVSENPSSQALECNGLGVTDGVEELDQRRTNGMSTTFLCPTVPPPPRPCNWLLGQGPAGNKGWEQGRQHPAPPSPCVLRHWQAQSIDQWSFSRLLSHQIHPLASPVMTLRFLTFLLPMTVTSFPELAASEHPALTLHSQPPICVLRSAGGHTKGQHSAGQPSTCQGPGMLP